MEDAVLWWITTIKLPSGWVESTKNQAQASCEWRILVGENLSLVLFCDTHRFLVSENSYVSVTMSPSS